MKCLIHSSRTEKSFPEIGFNHYPQSRNSEPTLKDACVCMSIFEGFPGGSDVKEPACSAGDTDSTPGSGRSPGKGNGNPLQYSCLEKSHGQRSLADYSPWGHKELDTTEQRSMGIMGPELRGGTPALFFFFFFVFCFLFNINLF